MSLRGLQTLQLSVLQDIIGHYIQYLNNHWYLIIIIIEDFEWTTYTYLYLRCDIVQYVAECHFTYATHQEATQDKYTSIIVSLTHLEM